MSQYTTVSFTANEEQTAMISALLMDLGFEGIEEQENKSIASIPSTLFDGAEVTKIFARFDLGFSMDTVDQQNWNAAWEQSFEPVVINNFVAVRASFHEPVPGVLHDIIVTPKMSFGTGHHATTYLMIQEMQQLDFEDKTVIDFGTGTAVLAILAEKLGASNILAIDNDEWSINNAKENADANNCSHISLQLDDTMLAEKKADIILANINLNVIASNLLAIKQACHANTSVLISGFLAGDEQQMQEVLSVGGFHIVKKLHRNDWMAMLIKTAGGS